MGIASILSSVIGPLIGGLFGGKEKTPSTPEPEKRPDETSEGIAAARLRRRTIADRTGRSALRTPSVSQREGQTRGGLTIVT